MGELKRRQAEIKEPKLTQVKVFFRRNARKFLAAGLFAVVFSAAALAPGIGITATVDLASCQTIVKGHPCAGYLCRGTINVTFNPILYPTNHLFGSTISSEFSWLSEPYDASGESVKESIIMQTLLSEFPVNLPFFYVVGFILATALEKTIKYARKKKDSLLVQLPRDRQS